MAIASTTWISMTDLSYFEFGRAVKNRTQTVDILDPTSDLNLILTLDKNTGRVTVS